MHLGKNVEYAIVRGYALLLVMRLNTCHGRPKRPGVHMRVVFSGNNRALMSWGTR